MIDIKDLSLEIGKRRLGPMSLALERGSLNVLLGASGCGKTSLLEAICGLRPLVAGSIRCDGDEIAGLPPARRGLAYVPQDLALFEALSPYRNLAFALEVAGWPAAEQRCRVAEVADLLRIGDLLQRPRLAGCSGGERQRLALGRALALRPRLLLLDEPFAALDPELRQELGAMLRRLCRDEGVTILMVTHSRAEAASLGDRCWLLREGRLERWTAPSEGGPQASASGRTDSTHPGQAILDQ